MRVNVVRLSISTRIYLSAQYTGEQARKLGLGVGVRVCGVDASVWVFGCGCGLLVIRARIYLNAFIFFIFFYRAIAQYTGEQARKLGLSAAEVSALIGGFIMLR